MIDAEREVAAYRKMLALAIELNLDPEIDRQQRRQPEMTETKTTKTRTPRKSKVAEIIETATGIEVVESNVTIDVPAECVVQIEQPAEPQAPEVDRSMWPKTDAERVDFISAVSKARREAKAVAKANGTDYVTPAIEVSFNAWKQETGGIAMATKKTTKTAPNGGKVRGMVLQYLHNGEPMPTAINYLSEVAARYSTKLVSGVARLKTADFVAHVKAQHGIDLSVAQPFAEIDLGNGHRIAATPFAGEVARTGRKPAAPKPEKVAKAPKAPKPAADAEAVETARALAAKKAGRPAPKTPAQ